MAQNSVCSLAIQLTISQLEVENECMFEKKYASKKVIIITDNINLNSSIILMECYAAKKSF